MQKLIRFSKKRITRLHKLLDSFPAGNEKEELHKIRLEIKKIKALLRVIHFNNPQFDDHKNYLPFRAIFRATGKLRDSVLKGELISQYTPFPSSVLKIPTPTMEHFKREIPLYQKKLNKVNRRISKEIQKINRSTYNSFIRKKKKQLTKILQKGYTQKELHGMRKLIKEISYLISIRKKKVPPFYIKSAQLIGDWHDKKVLIPWLRKTNPEQHELINELKSESRENISDLKKLVTEKLNRIKTTT